MPDTSHSDDHATDKPGQAPPCPVYEWTATEARYIPTVGELLREVGERFVHCGVDLDRVAIVMRTLHPLFGVSGFVWHGNTGEVSEFSGDHQSQSRDSYQRSPVRQIFDGSPGIRRRLYAPDCPDDFPILEDLRAEGITDYIALPLPFSDGRTYAISFATTAPAGFTEEQADRIKDLVPTLALVVEINAVRTISRTIAETYIGPTAGQRVLDGAIYRGVNETIDAVIWISDLRGFTALGDTVAPPVVLGILNDHFERFTEAITEQGGEVLKFMGDSLLAIFPVDTLGGTGSAVTAALTAARHARISMDQRNAERLERKLQPVRFGIGLHRGEVLYGNIGAPNRLDFTVIGPAVNHTARIEQLCRTLDRRVLVSAAIAESAAEELPSLGFQVLRGVREPQEIFALPDRPES